MPLEAVARFQQVAFEAGGDHMIECLKEEGEYHKANDPFGAKAGWLVFIEEENETIS
jgi:hypothetical protein